MGAGDGAVDHLQAVGGAVGLVQGLQHQLPQARERPSSELAMDREPSAELRRKVAPGRTGPGNPEHAVQHAPVILRRAAPLRAGLDHEGLEEGPFLVAHQSADHVVPPSKEGL